jgi:hypothetical protein
MGIEVASYRLGHESIVQHDAGCGPGAAPQDALAADVVERQAVQPAVAGLQVQAGVGGAGGTVELAGTEQHLAGLALAAAGRDDQCRVDGAVGDGGGLFRSAGQQGLLPGAAGMGGEGQVEAAAGACPWRAGRGCAGARHLGKHLGMQFGEGPAPVAGKQGAALRPGPGGAGQMVE